MVNPLQHATRTTTVQEKEAIKNMGAHQRTYVNSMLRTIEGGPVLRTKVMIDQGNTLHSGVAMSQELHKKLGGKFEKLGGREIPLAFIIGDFVF